ncbi:hypothetical protein D3C80_1394240 [compost metagenome]
MLQHAIGVFIADHSALALHGFTHMGKRMHPRGVHPNKERFVGLDLFIDEVDRRLRGLVVDGFHALFGQGAGVLDLAIRAGFDYPAW